MSGELHHRNKEADVLVVGAGPVGLTAGCELLRHGWFLNRR